MWVQEVRLDECRLGVCTPEDVSLAPACDAGGVRRAREHRICNVEDSDCDGNILETDVVQDDGSCKVIGGWARRADKDGCVGDFSIDYSNRSDTLYNEVSTIPKIRWWK